MPPANVSWAILLAILFGAYSLWGGFRKLAAGKTLVRGRRTPATRAANPALFWTAVALKLGVGGFLLFCALTLLLPYL
jgi:hypothetical protein